MKETERITDEGVKPNRAIADEARERVRPNVDVAHGQEGESTLDGKISNQGTAP